MRLSSICGLHGDDTEQKFWNNFLNIPKQQNKEIKKKPELALRKVRINFICRPKKENPMSGEIVTFKQTQYATSKDDD
jgi:hypothetical protein